MDGLPIKFSLKKGKNLQQYLSILTQCGYILSFSLFQLEFDKWIRLIISRANNI